VWNNRYVRSALLRDMTMQNTLYIWFVKIGQLETNSYDDFKVAALNFTENETTLLQKCSLQTL
jgi:hypothetical protein